MCESMVDIQSTTAEIGEEKKKKKKQDENIYVRTPHPAIQGGHKLECGTVPDAMAALPIIDGALCSRP